MTWQIELPSCVEDLPMGFPAGWLTCRPSGFILRCIMTKARNELRLITAAS
jgi:hypothetical protein